MKRNRFTEEQIIGALREVEAGAKAGNVARQHGVSEAAIYDWKAKFGSLGVSDVGRLLSLEDENARVKTLLADSMLGNAALKDLPSKKAAGPAAKREAAGHLQTSHQLSERRACNLVCADRSLVRYRSRRPRDLPLRIRTRGLNIVDSVMRECLAAVMDTPISYARVARELSRLVGMRIKPMRDMATAKAATDASATSF